MSSADSYLQMMGSDSISPSLMSEIEIRNYYLADWKYEKIMEQIAEFEEGLDETMVQLTSFGTERLMAVTEISYQNPDLIYFYGYVDGKPAQLIQITSQLNFLLLAVKKADPEKPAKRIAIGFAPPSEV